jgi:hypothetical protein
VRDDLAHTIADVFASGLELKDQLHGGGRPDFETEWRKLKTLLGGKLAANVAGVAASERGLDPSSHNAPPVMLTGMAPPRDAGMQQGLGSPRYPLACWLDEIFVKDSPWGDLWARRLMETEFFVSPERAYRFWQQLERLERVDREGSSDLLEVYYLAVMLGYRGDYQEQLGNRPEFRDHGDKLDAWASTAGARVLRNYVKGDCPHLPPALPDPQINVPPRQGQTRFQRMLTWGGGLAVVAVAAAILFLLFQS